MSTGTQAVEMSNSFYGIRLESIGGLGANLAGQMLAEAGVLGMGLSGANFSSYGSEKKGSPVKSFIRLGPPGMRLRTTSPVREPDLVAVFHEALLADPGVTAGLRPGGTLIINTSASPEAIASRVGLAGIRILTLDAIAVAVAEKTRVNTAMLGAIAHAASILDPEAIRRVIAGTFQKKYPQLVASNLRTFDRGLTEVCEYLVPESAADGAPADAGAESRPGAAAGLAVGYRTAPLGAVLSCPGSTVHKDVSASRQGFLPVFHRDRCVDCAICDLVCPDFCFVWEPTGQTVAGYPSLRLVGIDYQYCKGCMACVQECPTRALTQEREVGDLASRLTMRLNLGTPVAQGVPAGAGVLAESGWGIWDGKSKSGR